jgi:uncharacterized membrane protein
MALFSIRNVGAILAATGAAHLVKPEAFEAVTKTAFPDDTQAWVKRNGATEFAIGAALAVPKLRKLGVLGLLGYVGFLGSRAKANGAF